MASPDIYSEEWNKSCASRPASLRNDSEVSFAYNQFNIFILAFICGYFPIGLVAFWYTKRVIKTAYIAKRNLLTMLCALIGVFCTLAVGPIRDLAGRQNFSCPAMLWLRIFGVLGVVLPVSSRLIFFREQMMWAKAKKQISFQRLQRILAGEDNDMSKITVSTRKSIFKPGGPRVAGGSDITPRLSIGEEPEKTSEVTSQRSETRKGLSSGESSDDVDFQVIMRRQTFWFKAGAILLPITPLLLYGVIYQTALPYYRANCTGCYEDLIFWAIIGATIGVLVTVVFVVSWMIKGSADPLGLLTEIKWIVVVATPIGSAGLLGNLLDEYIGRPYDHGVFSFDWIILVALIWLWTLLVYVPMLKAYQANQKVSGARYDFMSFLQNPRAYKLFADHLANEWASENLKFWTQVETFKSQYAGFKKVRDSNIVAVQTFNTFIRPSAVMEVNIASSLRERLIKYFEDHEKDDPDFNVTKIPETIFDDAQREIYALMEKDSFGRFQNTKQFQEFISVNTTLDQESQRIVVLATNPNFS